MTNYTIMSAKAKKMKSLTLHTRGCLKGLLFFFMEDSHEKIVRVWILGFSIEFWHIFYSFLGFYYFFTGSDSFLGGGFNLESLLMTPLATGITLWG